MTRQEKIDSFFESAINKQMDIVGRSERMADLREIDEWYSKFTITDEQATEFKNWFIDEYRKVFRSNKERAKKEFAYFNLAYGLRNASH